MKLQFYFSAFTIICYNPTLLSFILTVDVIVASNTLIFKMQKDKDRNNLIILSLHISNL